MTPNGSFNSSPQGTSMTIIGIRGLKNPNIELANEQPVATYMTGDPLGDTNTKYVRTQAGWNATEKFAVVLRAHYLKNKTHGTSSRASS